MKAFRLEARIVTRYYVARYEEDAMAAAERMKAMRERRRRRGLREVRLMVPDVRSANVRRRIAAQVARLNQRDEREALAWIESVSDFDGNASR
jgi:hypothetical protein